jgi:cell division transport system ATP-binding protein
MIDFQNVSVSYGNNPVLTDISFHIDPGEFIFLTGKSGVGKTTIMRLLTGQTKPDSGTIIVDGINYDKLKSRDIMDIRRRIGVIYQDYKLLPERTVAENIALGLEIMRKSKSEIESRVTDLLKLIELPDKGNLFPSQLSGGEAQRVCIARALATAPKVIFADEPTGNLDDETGMLIASLLMKLNELGTTVIMATHNMSIVSHFASARRVHLEGTRVSSDEKSKPKSKSKKAEDKK